MERLDALMRLVQETGIARLDVTEGKTRIRLRADGMADQMAGQPREAEPPQPVADAWPTADAMLTGVVYLAPSPEADPFVAQGDQVAAGQTLCLIEAMKTLTPVIAPCAGRIKARLVEDAQPVEAGQPLFRIEGLDA